MRFTLAICFLAGSAAWAADVTPLDVKTGEWEFTMKMQVPGSSQTPPPAPQIPEDQLSKLPPAQRAQVEAALKQYAAAGRGRANSITSKTCIKKEDLTKLNPRADAQKSCKTTILSSSHSKQEIKIDCDVDGSKQSGTMTVEAVNSETLQFSLQSSGTDQGKAFGMNMSGTGKFLSSTCTEAK